MTGCRVRRRGAPRRATVAPAIRWVAQKTSAAHGAVLVVEPVGAPLPAIADDVVQAEIVLHEGIDRREAVKTVGPGVVARECALPDVAAMLSARRLVIAPRKAFCFEAAARRLLPFRLGRQSFSRPLAERQRVIVRDVNLRQIVATAKIGLRP